MPMHQLTEQLNAPDIPQRIIVSAQMRSYQVSGREFVYKEKPLSILMWTNSYACSGSNQCGLWGIVRHDKEYHHKEFSKEANAFRTDSVFWDCMEHKFNFNIPNNVPMLTAERPSFIWFNIGLYWHWFGEDLPCIRAFRAKGYDDLPIYTNKLTYWQLQSLEYFPDIMERIVQVDTPTIIWGTQLYTVTYPATSYRGQSSKWVGNWLRANMPVKNQWDRRRVYITRKDAIARNVDNEKEVVTMLMDHNFHYPYTLENMTIREKIDMFGSADIVVSPTGAGLTHCYAMRPGTHVIDFNHSFEVAAECGWNNFGDSVNLNWQTLIAETTRPSERPKPKNSHMSVNVDELEHAVVRSINQKT